jgi:uncharacterized protein (TIGR00255 family)
MTGYGLGRAEAAGTRVTVEIRGVNQRFLDVRVTAPREYAAWERDVRDRVQAAVARGRIEVTVSRSAVGARGRRTVRVRLDVAEAYLRGARTLARTFGVGGRVALPDLLRLPDLFEARERAAAMPGELAALRRALAAALRAFEGERLREGRALRRDMMARATRLRATAAGVRRRALRQRVKARLRRLAGGVTLDRARVTQEVAVLADRSDITEELVRLESHLAALTQACGTSGPVGKRIEFLLQEIQRELNTAGAKAADPVIGTLVLAGKEETEKLREQVQNVE